jgi:hypothetical protein
MNFHPDALVQLANMAVDDRLRAADRQRQRRAVRRARLDPPSNSLAEVPARGPGTGEGARGSRRPAPPTDGGLALPSAP